MEKISIKKERIFLTTWVVLPILLLWISINYLIGINRHTVWETQNDPKVEGAVISQPPPSPPPQISKFKWDGQALITLWFDDAWASQFTVAYPLLEDKHLTGALAVPTSFIGYPDYMSWTQVKLLQYKGWEITSHTRSHSCKPEELTADFIDNELKGSQLDLNSRGFRADNFVTPCGAESKPMDEVVKKYYLSLRTSYPGLNTLPVLNPYSLKVRAIRNITTAQDTKTWMEEAKKKKAWLIIMIHQIDNSNSEYGTTPTKFKEMVQVISDSKVPVVLPTQVLQMIVNTSEESPTNAP